MEQKRKTRQFLESDTFNEMDESIKDPIKATYLIGRYEGIRDTWFWIGKTLLKTLLFVLLLIAFIGFVRVFG